MGYTASGTAVAGPYENIGTATGYTPQDVPVTDSDISSYIGRGEYGLIAPTSTSVGQYIDGTAMSFEDYYAAQGGVIEYSVRNGQIHQTNPGVFFYYTGLSNTIVGVNGADAGTSADPMTILIDQSDDSGLVGPFKMTKNDVKLFKVNDLDGNGIDAGDTYTQVRLNNSQITLGTGVDSGDVTINFTPDAVGSLYVVSVQYETRSVVGTDLGAATPTVNYTFDTDVGADGTIDETAEGGITMALKGSVPPLTPLMLDGDVGNGAPALSEAQLEHAIAQAIQYWENEGISDAELAFLEAADFTITDLAGAMLAGSDGKNVTIDADAAGHGWSLGLGGVAPNKVDLLSAVTHEFGHLLGLDHDDMEAALAVGERDLPQGDLPDVQIVAIGSSNHSGAELLAA